MLSVFILLNRTCFFSNAIRRDKKKSLHRIIFRLLMRTNYARIPFAALLGQEEIPSLGAVLNREDYEGPRTTSASIAVAKHIRSFYRLFGTIGIILAISVFHIIAIIFGHAKRNACPALDMAPKIIMIFGIIDLSICGIIIIIVCFSRHVIPKILVNFS